MIHVQVVKDSISSEGIRITTMLLTYPRFIHAEVMTHRVFSRNASSSRAIPVQKLLSWVKNTPAEPIHWGENQKGMQASKEVTGFRLWALKFLWRLHRKASLCIAWMMAKLGGHKQLVNRIIENHGHINVLVTSTQWENFLFLRDSKMAMPEIEALAQAIRLRLANSSPELLLDGEWHLPYIMHEEKKEFLDGKLLMISAARCARTSYLTHDGRVPDALADLELANKLIGPKHMSPFEHQATPDVLDRKSRKSIKPWKNPSAHGNFTGWIQHRKLLPDECVPG